MNDFNDRLLDASLKEYSRVTPPDGFVVRPVAKSARWIWMAIPAVAATAAAILVMMLVQPAAIPGPPAKIFFVASAPQVSKTAKRLGIRPHEQEPPHSHFRTLTGAEIARMTLPAGLFAPREENPIVELQVPELSVKPLESDDPNPDPKE